jgi:hypothetical protein
LTFLNKQYCVGTLSFATVLPKLGRLDQINSTTNALLISGTTTKRCSPLQFRRKTFFWLDMPSIDILCIAGPNAEDYAAYLLRNAQSLASGLHDLHWKTVVSKSEKTLPGFEKIGFVPGVGQGSANHAACLDVGIPLLTSEYCFLLDLDVLFALAVGMISLCKCSGKRTALERLIPLITATTGNSPQSFSLPQRPKYCRSLKSR